MFTLKSSQGYLQVKVSGTIRRKDYEELTKEFNSATAGGKKTNVLLEIDSIEGLEPGVMIRDFEFGKSEEPKISKMAIVTDTKFIIKVTEIFKHFFREKERAFSLEQKQAAIEWLKSNL